MPKVLVAKVLVPKVLVPKVLVPKVLVPKVRSRMGQFQTGFFSARTSIGSRNTYYPETLHWQGTP